MRGPVVAGIVLSVVAACGDDATPTTSLQLVRVGQTADLDGCAYASPVVVASANHVIVGTSAGEVVAYDVDGAEVWHTSLPADAAGGRRAWLAATPVVIDDRLVVAWQDAAIDGDDRRSHHVAVIDAATGELDAAFPTVTLAATQPSTDGGVVEFVPANSFSRSTLVHAMRPGDDLGVVYVSLGNIRDIQPWHGWVFELDLDAWRAAGAGAAIAGVRLTTPEDDCGPDGKSGSDEMICGGGVWAPNGPTVVTRAGASELWLPTGNGQLDLTRGDYANTIMRLQLDLDEPFDPACSAACDDFDPIDPAPACMASCADLFMPRLAPGDPPLAPHDGLCDGMTFLECYARLDLDLGADAPALVTTPSGKAVVVLPAKDGAVYLFDAEHFGTMYQRVPVREFCGANGGTCRANWAGTMVTRPVVAAVDDQPVVVVATFVFDNTNPGGLVAFDVIDDAVTGVPALRERWRGPNGDAATARFREHTGQPVIVEAGGESMVAIADPGEDGQPVGELFVLRLRDGAVMAQGAMTGHGRKYVEPAVVASVSGARLLVTSCDGGTDTGPTHVELWDLTKAP